MALPKIVKDIEARVRDTGDTMTGLLSAHGGISLNDSTPQNTAPQYLLGITAFAEGGTVQWSAVSSVASALMGSLDGRYVNISGDTMTGTLVGKNIDLNATGNSIAPLIIRGGTGGYMEGIRILGTGGATGWADIVLGGATNSGIDANQWFIGVNNQSFYLTHAGSSSSSTGFFSSDTSGNWLIQNTLGIGGRNTSYKLYIGGSTYIAGNITTGTAGASIHHVNGTYTSNIGLLYANGGIEIREAGLCTTTQSALNYGPTLGFHWGGRVAHSLTLGSDGVLYHYNNGGALATFKAGAIYGAVWNDYAEYRLAESIEPGRCIIEHKSGEMKLSTERLQPGAEIISDTFGFAIGESEESKTPIAAAGRVLAYPNEDRYSYPLGCAVCSGPNGTVSQMTREEIREYPERIIGTVSEIPEYETWGAGNVPVNGRIWIRIK